MIISAAEHIIDLVIKHDHRHLESNKGSAHRPTDDSSQSILRKLQQLLSPAEHWTDELRRSASSLILAMLDSDRLVALAHRTGNPGAIPLGDPLFKLAYHSIIDAAVVTTPPAELLRICTELVDDQVRAQQALEQWRRQHRGSQLDLGAEIKDLVTNLLETRDKVSDDFHLHLEQLIQRVRDEATLGRKVLTRTERRQLEAKLLSAPLHPADTHQRPSADELLQSFVHTVIDLYEHQRSRRTSKPAASP